LNSSGTTTVEYSGLVLITMAAVGVAALAAGAPWRPATVLPRRALWIWLIAAAAAGCVMLGPLATPAPLWAAVGIDAAAAIVGLGVAIAVLERHAPSAIPPALTAAAVVIIPALGWSLSVKTLTVTLVAVIALVVATAGAATRIAVLRAGLAAVEVAAIAALAAAVTAALGHGWPAAGFAVSISGAAVLTAVTILRPRIPQSTRTAVQVCGVAAILIGELIAAGSWNWLAAAATAGAVGLSVAAIGAKGRTFMWLAIFGWVGALCAWEAAADVRVLEAYTIPLAAGALLVGVIMQRSDSSLSSWSTLTVGLIVGLGPTLIVAVARGGPTRTLGIIAAGLVCVAVGAMERLRAPLILGCTTLLVIGANALAPAAAAIPRWIPLALAGVLLLWMGSSFERRIGQVRALRASVADHLR
jgi:hypothetical protein